MLQLGNDANNSFGLGDNGCATGISIWHQHPAISTRLMPLNNTLVPDLPELAWAGAGF
jgi:hypothetical protein